MDDLLDALGIHSQRSRQICMIGIAVFVPASVLAFAFGQAYIEATLHESPFVSVFWVVCVWIVWTVWHSVLFPKGRQRLLKERRNPYRAAFVTHIYPGVTVAFAQMLRPLFNGDVISRYDVLFLVPPSGLLGWSSFLVGNAICVGAGMLFVWAWETIGTANAGFVPEFTGTRSFVPLQTGPYKYIRHPLFWSGIYFSCGLACLVNTYVSYSIAIVNAAYGLVYNLLEDRRLIAVFGEPYSAYSRIVPRCVPKWTR